MATIQFPATKNMSCHSILIPVPPGEWPNEPLVIIENEGSTYGMDVINPILPVVVVGPYLSLAPRWNSRRPDLFTVG